MPADAGEGRALTGALPASRRHVTARTLEDLGPVIPSYTRLVKTAISLPDETYERVTRRAQDLGMSRSEFFARAAEHYLSELDDESLTDAINEALKGAADGDDSNAAAAAAGRSVVGAGDW